MKKLILVLLTVFMFLPLTNISAAITPSTFKPTIISTRDDGTRYKYTDSSGTTHKIGYGQADNFKKGFRFLFDYTDSSFINDKINPNKDGCLKIEHFENVSGKMVSMSNEKIDIKQTQVNLLEFYIDKKYLDDQYIYFKLSFMSNMTTSTVNKAYYIRISNPYYITGVKLSTKDIYLLPGQTYNGKATLTPSNAEFVHPRGYSSNKEIAEVENDYKGNFTVKAIKPGSTTMTYRTYNGKTVSCNIIVVSPDFPFFDVKTSAWYYDTVKEAYKLGLMTGATETLFKPESNMNRAMVACVFHRMEGSPKTAYEQKFSDVESGQYYSSPVTWAANKKVINGYDNGTFKPTKNVTREEMITMAANFAKYKGKYTKKTTDLYKFKDGTQVSLYARESMQWGLKSGILSGKDNGTRLDPKGTATRAECSKMLLKTYKLIYNK